MEAAIAAGATVVWCLSEPKRMNFFGYRETHLGYAAPKVAGLVVSGGDFAGLDVSLCDVQLCAAHRMGRGARLLLGPEPNSPPC